MSAPVKSSMSSRPLRSVVPRPYVARVVRRPKTRAQKKSALPLRFVRRRQSARVSVLLSLIAGELPVLWLAGLDQRSNLVTSKALSFVVQHPVTASEHHFAIGDVRFHAVRQIDLETLVTIERFAHMVRAQKLLVRPQHLGLIR